MALVRLYQSAGICDENLSVVVNDYEAKNDNDLADTIVHRINDMLNEDGSVWGK